MTTRTPAAQVFRNLVKDLEPTIVFRANFDDELGHFRTESRRQLALGKSRVAVIGNIGSAHGIGAALGDHARVIAQHAAKIALSTKLPKIRSALPQT